MTSKTLTMLGVGDLGFMGAESEAHWSTVSPTLKAADVVIGQVEQISTTRPTWTYLLESMVLPPPRDPDCMRGLPLAGFNVITLAGNHVWDVGANGIEDTCHWLRNHGISVLGAGMTLDEAKRPVIIEHNGIKLGILDYNCTGPRDAWALKTKPGCAYVRIITHYELDYAVPGGTPDVFTWAEPSTLEAMQDDVRRLRPDCDVLVVALHKGLIHTPVKLAQYERPVCHAAIDAGADLILGHHHHILRGIELYKGKAIFHGLCNFGAYVQINKSLTPQPSADPRSWAFRRRELFNFMPDPEYPTYPFHPEAKYTIIAKCIIGGGKISRVSYLPCLINKNGQTEILGNDKRGQQVFDYMDKITRAEGLNVQYEWEGDEVVIRAE